MAEVCECRYNPCGYLAAPEVFPEHSVWTPLARSIGPVTVVNQDFHSWFCNQVNAPNLHKISEKSKKSYK